jgi:hypothetical protein
LTGIKIVQATISDLPRCGPLVAAAPSTTATRTTHRLDRLDVQTQAMERANHERARGQLFLDRRMRLRPGLGVDDLTILPDVLEREL